MLVNYIRYFAIIILLSLNTRTYSQTAQIGLDSTSHFSAVLSEYERFVEQALATWEAPGAAIAVVKDHKIFFIKGFGIRKAGQPEQIDSHTVFRLASVSKGFASVVTGLLVQDSILHWDDKVIRYLPGFSLKSPDNTQQLTIRHILSHTTGLPQHAYTNLLEENVPYPTIVRRLKNVHATCPVGKCYGYQNVAYSLIGDILRAVTGKEYEQLLVDRLFLPLGMYNASLGRKALLAEPNQAAPHIRESYFSWTATEIGPAFYSVLPSAGVNASISDLAKWLQALLGGMPGIIAPELVQQVTTPQVRTPQELRKYVWRDRLVDAHYGLGWRIYNYAGTRLIYHGGWVQGYRAEIAFIPEQKIGIATLVHSESMMANLLVPTFFDMYLGFDDK